MLCCSEQCDKKEQCALFYRNPQPEHKKYDNVESLATHGWGRISVNGYEDHYDCGPLGDYKMFEPLNISTDYEQWKQWLDNWQKDIMCNEVPFQTYECCYHIYLPWKCKSSWKDDNKKVSQIVSIDKCLLPEILSLWEMGIKTTGCCCGHGRQKPFIGVTEDNIQRMKNLGYKVQFNSCRPEAEDSFIPKTELNYGKSKCTEV